MAAVLIYIPSADVAQNISLSECGSFRPEKRRMRSVVCATHPSIDGVHVQLCLFGPFLPEVWILQGDVCSVASCNKTGLKGQTSWLVFKAD